MMNKHTQGPWRYWKERGYVSELTATNGTLIAGFDTDPSEANARLIAAAPDLLESAKLLIDSYDICRKDRTPDVIFERLRAAILKATGKHHE